MPPLAFNAATEFVDPQILIQAHISRDAPLSVVMEGEEDDNMRSARLSMSTTKDEVSQSVGSFIGPR